MEALASSESSTNSFIRLHGVTSQNIALFTDNVVRTSNPKEEDDGEQEEIFRGALTFISRD
jgi:hypothetical protein